MANEKHPHNAHQRMTKDELKEKLNTLQSSPEIENELQELLHELEVHQIELEMQNRELRESRAALEDSLDRYVDLYDFAPIGYVTMDEIGLIKNANLTLAGMLGVERRWLIGRSLSPWFLGPNLHNFRNHMRKCAGEERPQTTALQLARKDHSVLEVELLTTHSLDALTGKVLYRTAMTDISARKRAEAERDRFFDLSNDCLSLAGTDGYFKRVNPAWEKTLGYSQEELLAHPFMEFIHPDDRDEASAQLEKIEKTASRMDFQTRFVTRNRKIIWLTWKTVLVNGTYYSVARDTTRQHLEKVAAENEKNWLRRMIETIPSPMLLVEADSGKVVSMSPSVFEMVEGIEGNIPDTQRTDFICEDPSGKPFSTYDLPRMRAARGEELNGEPIVWRTPRRITHLLAFSRNIQAAFGQPAMALIVYQDVTSLRGIEKSLRETVSNLEQERDLRERFVSTLTHDLRTPLMTVKMSSQLIVIRPDTTESTRRLAERMAESVERMDYMIHDLLDANRLSAGEELPLKRETQEIVALTKTTLGVLNEIYENRFRLKGLAQCCAYVDPMALRRVIENLCTNAIKYGDPQAPVTVTIEKSHNQLSLSVHNEGPPIPLTDQPVLFKPFQRAISAEKSGKKGWGIGLFLVRGIIESHGGKVEVVSAPGQGTTFIIALPLSVAHSEAQKAPTNIQNHRSKAHSQDKSGNYQ